MKRYDAVAAKESAERMNKAAMRKLWIVCFVSTIFIACELVGGYLANSIAIMSDAAHLASDLLGFAISMIAIKLG